MSVSNATVADTLRRYATALTLDGADRFKVKAYRRAAETIEELPTDVSDFVEQGHELTELPGIGKAISQVVTEIIRSGKLTKLDQKLAELTPERKELAAFPRLDPKRVARAYKKLGISSIRELKAELENGKVREILGARVDYHFRRALDDRPRHLLWSIEDFAESLLRRLRGLPGVLQVSTAGSLRRKQDTVGDLNFLFSSKKPAEVFQAVAKFGSVQSSERRSATEHHYKLSSGLAITLRSAPPDEWGLSLIEATGSAAHLEELGLYAVENDLPLGKVGRSKKEAGFIDEEAVYESLGLAFIEPELREGRGEVAAAAEGDLPRLVTLDDLRGDLHMHTTASDGANSIAEMAEACKARGYEYLAITDHSQSLRITNGLSEERLLAHIEQIDKLNAKLRGIRILKSAEVDILEDGKLDYTNRVLKELDFTICSIHSKFALDRDKQTARILRAMDNPYFNILGHATGRLLLSREGYEIDIERIIRHAQANGCLFEINSSPNRLDLSDEHARLAKDAGIPIAINTDAHSISELDFISAGVNQGRRAWLSADDVLNTRPLRAMLKLLKR